MVDERLFVVHGREVAATLIRGPRGRLPLAYDSTWVERSDATPLSVGLPLARTTYGDAKLRPWLWGLLADNDAVLNRWAREFGVSGANPCSLLSTLVGEDCVGAFWFVPPDRLDAAMAEDGGVGWTARCRRDSSTPWQRGPTTAPAHCEAF